MPSPCRPDREAGAATAELAVVLPALVLVTAALLGALAAGAVHLRQIDAAATAARSAARGDPAGTTASLVAAAGVGRIRSVAHDGGLVCVTVGADVPVLGDAALPLSARSCALEAAG